ncbi:radical SAM protein [Kibdelosporangium persicum]|uniref:DNA repair photolyase n=1 Tax=Kibdelosporangium persicum TaxID=2698649 RepID=A0ABX2F374_9PSEU|nr:radical SAM protein [Kibdelosporangium persicum]NRN65770.1 DNA repair photolyase [Kibdelosporangium persicum]
MTISPTSPAPAQDRPAVTSRKPLPILTEQQRAGLRPELLEVIENRKSGLSLNHVIGCPLDCGYCVRHLFDNFAMKVPRALMSDEQAVDLLVGHRFFQPHVTPIQLLNRATDPMLPAVKPHTFATLRLLDAHKLTNHVLVISRWRVEPADCAVLNSFRNIKLTLLITHSGIEHDQVEPVDSTIAATSLRTAFEHAERYRTVLYWRPIVPGLNDSDEHLSRALDLSRYAHATVFTGLFYKDQIRAYYRDHGLPEPYQEGARRKVFPEALEQRILAAARSRPDGGSPLFRKTSCAVTYAHGVADFNGHYGIRELCDICPASQLQRCAKAWTRPQAQKVAAMAERLGGKLVGINDRAVVVAGLDEQCRYVMQHSLGYQVHDVSKPHHPRRHGRADLGWPATMKETTP